MNIEIYRGNNPPETRQVEKIRFKETEGEGSVEILPRHADIFALGIGHSLELDNAPLPLACTFLFTKQTVSGHTRIVIVAPEET